MSRSLTRAGLLATACVVMACSATGNGELRTFQRDPGTDGFVAVGADDTQATAEMDEFGNIRITDVRSRWWGDTTIHMLINVDMSTGRQTVLDEVSTTRVSWVRVGGAAMAPVLLALLTIGWWRKRDPA